jgi:alpha-D-xyloside xylohydrolase
MKFTDGQWILQPGVSAFYPAEVHDVTTEGESLVIHAPTRPIKHRGDTLGGPLLTVTLSAPMDDVVRVRLEHFVGAVDRNPQIPLQPVAAPKVVIENTNTREATSLRTGGLTARVKRDGWEIVFEGGGRMLTKSGWRGLGYIQWPGHGNFVHEQLNLGVGECVYGLGERFTAFVKNGQVVENVNKDGGTASEQAYKSVPFYMTNRGYGVLVNSTGPVSFEVASEKVARVQFSQPGESLEYFLIYGPTPKEILRKLTALTGRPALPPAWTFGLWLTTSFTTSYDEATCVSFIEGMKSRDLPLHVFHFDCFWMREFDWCNFQWDPRTFPDPVGMLKRLHERGLKISLWINPYIGQRSVLFEEGRKGGYFIKTTAGAVWQTDLWQPGMAIVDFTNPAACKWFGEHLRRLAAMGVDSFKTDFGERIPTEGIVYHDGSDPAGMHNFYPILYNEVVFKVLEEIRGKGEAALFARSSYASGQRFPIHWGGDSWSTLESMAESLRGGLSLSACGFGYWSHDIGGFEGLPPAAVYKRWVAFGLMSSHSRLHGSSSYRVPWNYDDDACDVLRFFTKLKCRLMPYLYAVAVEAHREGVPMMRPMQLEFPNDPACDTLDRQYMLGGSLLVAPVFSEDGWVDYYLPEGRWTHLLTGEIQEGGRWRRAQYGFLSLGLFVRNNTALAIGAIDARPDYDYADDVTIHVYDLADGAEASCRVTDVKGVERAELNVRRQGDRYEAHVVSGQIERWSLAIGGAFAAAGHPMIAAKRVAATGRSAVIGS